MIHFFKVCLRIIIFFCVLFSGVSRAEEVQEQVVLESAKCRAIANHNLRSLQRTNEGSFGDSVKDPYAMYNFLTESISNPQEYDQRNRAFTILSRAEYKESLDQHATHWTVQSVLDETSVHDLNLLSGSKENPGVYCASILAEWRVNTEIGKAYLCGLLARPTDDIKLLEARQNIIKKLVEDKVFFDACNDLLQGIAPCEKMFTGLWDSELLMSFIQNSYSKMDLVGPYINKSPISLDIRSLVGSGLELGGTAVLAVTPVVLTIYGLSLLSDNEPLLAGCAGPCFGQFGMLFKLFPFNRWIEGSIALLVAGMSTLFVKQSVQGCHVNFLFDSFLRKRLVYVSKYVEKACALSGLLHGRGVEFLSGLEYATDLRGFFDGSAFKDEEFVQLCKLLKSQTFAHDSEEKNELFFRRGNVFCAYYLLNVIKQKFERMMVAIGELDAYVAVAKLVRENSQGGAQYCFPTYVKDASSPSIQLKDFWNPFVDRHVVVSNSLDLGMLHGVPNMVITGPNSAGKSTILKGIALATILAQSVGIAPARSMKLTPLSYIVTYMNVIDSIVDQESRFQAEARRVFAYGDCLQELEQQNKFSLALFDEILSGTSPTEGADLGYKIAHVLAGYRKSVALIATHFEKLTSLEIDTQGHYVNYNVAVDQNLDGSIKLDKNNKIQRQFKLLPGPSHQHIAKEVFHEKGIVARSPFFEQCFAS